MISEIYLKCHKILRESLPFLSSVDFLKNQITNKRSKILDLGCGKGTSLSIELSKRENSYLIGVDLFLPSLVEAKTKEIYRDLVLADARYLPFKSASFDVTIASQVIEHLAKSEKLTFKLEQISRELVIITVPVGSNPKHNLEDSNLHQAHSSEWHPEEFRRLGFEVWGGEGARFLRGEQSQFRLGKNFYFLSYFLSIFTQFITFKLVDSSYQMLCVKQLNIPTHSTSKIWV